MSMTWRVAWLAWLVVGLGAGDSRAAVTREKVPRGGFPAEGVEFLVVSPGHGVCLALGRGRLPSPSSSASAASSSVAAGRPCEWEAPGAEQRWRYHAGRLINVASGECLLAASLGPCAVAEDSEVSYELLAQRLVLRGPRTGCFAVGAAPGGPFLLGLVPLDSRECGAEHVASKWMLVPL